MATENVSFTLKKETIKKIRELAKKERRSVSNMVEYILYSHFTEKDRPTSET